MTTTQAITEQLDDLVRSLRPRDCVCAECNETFALPAIVECPACGSRQVRRANALEAHAEALAEQLFRAQGALTGIGQWLRGAEFPSVARQALDCAEECDRVLAAFHKARNASR